MKTLLEGLFTPERFLAYIRDFIVFEEVQERITKKGAKYHQYFAVRKAVEKTVEAATTGNDRRVGVIWHTTGSGKSLSMAYLVGILRRQPELQNPSIVIQVDRTDLDDQLYEQFVADYPDDDFVDDAHILLENLGKDDEEIIRSFTEKNDAEAEEVQ